MKNPSGLPFTKMHGLGNDYIYINCFENPVKQPERLSQFLSNRQFGIGADGLVLIEPSKEADLRMRMFNADGSEAQMCGNAIRCVARYAYEKNICRKTELSVETRAGKLSLVLTLGENDTVEKVRVNMGKPEFAASKIPVLTDLPEAIEIPVTVGTSELRLTCVSMGNPHAVIFVDEITDYHINEIGRVLENHPLFPERINVEFVSVQAADEVTMRVWERGSGETLACGTGAAAVVAAGFKTGRTGEKVTVHLKGGDLLIEIDADGYVFKEGPATFVYDGILYQSEDQLIHAKRG